MTDDEQEPHGDRHDAETRQRSHPDGSEEETPQDEPMLAVAERFFDALHDEFDALRRLADGDLGFRDLREMSLLASPTILRAFAGAYHAVAVDGTKSGSPEPIPNGNARMRTLFRQLARSMGCPSPPVGSRPDLSPERRSKAPGSKKQELCARDHSRDAPRAGPISDLTSRSAPRDERSLHARVG